MLKAFLNPNYLECGTDEAGRGCLAGPVTAAALNNSTYSSGINLEK
jgi:ribonuclease HII